MTYTMIYILKFYSYDIWVASNISRLIDNISGLNYISIVPISELDLGIIVYILRAVLFTCQLGLVGALK